jgi:hypothetical protein
MPYALIYAFEHPNEWGFMVLETNMNEHAAHAQCGVSECPGMESLLNKTKNEKTSTQGQALRFPWFPWTNARLRPSGAQNLIDHLLYTNMLHWL